MTTLSDFRTLDQSDMLGAIGQMPAQLRDGLARSRSAEGLQHAWPVDMGAGAPKPRTLIVCGMGGSGVAASLLPATIDTFAPVVGVNGYELPSWANDEDRVICVSYSGDTAETIACFQDALTRSVIGAVITTGGTIGELARAEGIPVIELPPGLQPRAAVGVLFGALAGTAERFNVIADAGEIVEEAATGASHVVSQQENASGEDVPALTMARQLHDRVMVVYGAGPTAAVAWRWKAQVNENAKVPCFANVFPELNHNEIVGWQFARESGAHWALVELIPHDVSDEMLARFDATRESMADVFDVSLRIEALSSSRAGSIFEQLAWGDYVSAYLALIRGVDPTPVARIADLKARLAGN